LIYTLNKTPPDVVLGQAVPTMYIVIEAAVVERLTSGNDRKRTV